MKHLPSAQLSPGLHGPRFTAGPLSRQSPKPGGPRLLYTKTKSLRENPPARAGVPLLPAFLLVGPFLRWPFGEQRSSLGTGVLVLLSPRPG